MPEQAPTKSAGSNWPPRKGAIFLVAIVAAFLLLRLPLIVRQIGGHDEEYFAPTGSTVLREGIPSIPYIRIQDRTSGFYRADEVLLAYPPLHAYYLAAVYSILPEGYPAAQFASAIAGAFAIVLVYFLGRRFYGDQATALAACAIYSLAGFFYLPAIHARPDSLCAALGLAAALCASRWFDSRRWRDLVLSGLAAGAALLTHPFGIVACVQVGLLAVASGRTWRERFVAGGVVTLAALSVMALWLPLIVQWPDIFRVQFFNNVLNRSGPGLALRLAWPWKYLWLQAQFFWEKYGTCHAALVACGLLIATTRDLRGGSKGARLALYWAWSGVFLLAVIQGSHPLQSYWIYPGAFLCVCVARSLAVGVGAVAGRWPRWRTVAGWALGLATLALLLPGSGLRALAVQIVHFRDQAYDRPRFTKALIEGLPAEARYLVDPEYIYPFYLAGRYTILPVFHRGEPYDYFVAGPSSLDQDLPQYSGERIAVHGIPNNPFTCYAEVYRRPGSGQAPRVLDEEVAALADKYALRVVHVNTRFPVAIAHGDITGRDATAESLEKFQTILVPEWNLYPPSLIKATGLARIVLCEDLAFDGQPRTAIPDFEHHDLYFDVARGSYSPPYVRSVIHHEFFHVIDNCDDGQLYADEKWAALLPAGTRYGTGGKDAQLDASMSLVDDSLPGFLTPYSMTAVEEDKAEMFAHLVVNGAMVEKRSGVDATIAAKARLMKALLRKFCPEMDDSFWDAARRLARP